MFKKFTRTILWEVLVVLGFDFFIVFVLCSINSFEMCFVVTFVTTNFKDAVKKF